MNGFERKFEEMAHTEDASILFTGFLDWVIDANLIAVNDRKLDFHGREQDYFELYQEWIKIVDNELKTTGKWYYDYLGVFYEDIIQSKFKAGTRGQFFTPQDVGRVMAELCFSESSHDGFTYDCACGSGRLLLDAHEQNPNNILIGWDMDRQACKMAVLNLYISGARGSILCKNSLSGEFFEAWRVNNYLGYGLNVPHIEYVSELDAYRFFGKSITNTHTGGTKVTKGNVVNAPKPNVKSNGTLEAWL